MQTDIDFCEEGFLAGLKKGREGHQRELPRVPHEAQRDTAKDGRLTITGPRDGQGKAMDITNGLLWM